MKIIGLKAQNILNLKAVEIAADGKSVVLSGKNGAGKSAILDSIWMALTGKKVEQPLRQGEEKGEIVVTTENFVVKRTFGKGEGLKVTSLDGKAIFSSPQAFLNEVLGEIAFNPVQFAEMGKTTAGVKQQREMLMVLSKLDFSDIDNKLTDLIADRTAKNRELKRLQAVLESSPKPEAGLPDKEISMQDELNVIESMEKAKKKHDEYLEQMHSISESIQSEKDGIDESERTIEDLRKKIQAFEQSIGQAKNRIAVLEKEKIEAVEPALVTDEQIAQAKRDLAGIEKKNQKIRQAQDYATSQKSVSDAQGEADAMTKQIEDLKAQKSERIKSAVYPLEGLAVDDECVLYKGVPLSQQSTGLQMKISMAIAMALNPKLRLILLRDAALLDSEGLKAITEMAEAQDYQLWIEKVDDSGKVGIFIEDGEITAVDGRRVEAPAV